VASLLPCPCWCEGGSFHSLINVSSCFLPSSHRPSLRLPRPPLAIEPSRYSHKTLYLVRAATIKGEFVHSPRCEVQPSKCAHTDERSTGLTARRSSLHQRQSFFPTPNHHQVPTPPTARLNSKDAPTADYTDLYLPYSKEIGYGAR
jgi:hypothetical protein